MFVKPETDKELLKAIEDMENIAVKAKDHIYEDVRTNNSLDRIVELSRLCQAYLKERLNGRI